MDERLKKIAVYRTNDPEINQKVLDRFAQYGALVPSSMKATEGDGEKSYMVNVNGEVFIGGTNTVISKDLDLVEPDVFFSWFPEKEQEDDDTPDIFECAVSRVRNFDINNAVVSVFEKYGGKCTLSHEEMSPEVESNVFLMDSQKKIRLTTLSDAYEGCYRIFSPESFLDEFVGKPSIEARDRMMEKKEREQEKPVEAVEEEFPFHVAFYGEKDSKKSDIIARVFKKHGLSNTSWSFGIEGAIYCIQNSGTIYSNGNARSFIEKGFEVTTIDKYLDDHPEDLDCLSANDDEEQEENMRVVNEREHAFFDLSAEILEFLNKPFCHPHMTIIADCNHVELVEGVSTQVKRQEEE